MKKEEYAKWSTAELLAKARTNKVAKAVHTGVCMVGYSCFLLFGVEILALWLLTGVTIIIALYLWSVFGFFNKELTIVKEELKKRQYSKEDEIATDIWLKKFYITMIILPIVSVLLSLGISSIREGDESKCTICNEPASHSFQGSGYCETHYNDAVRWAIDNVSE